MLFDPSRDRNLKNLLWNNCSSKNCSRYSIGSSEVTNNRNALQGDQHADCMVPVVIVQRSGCHFLSQDQTRKTFATVEENKQEPSGDHFKREQGGPTLFNAVFCILSTFQIKISVSPMEADAKRVPSEFHCTDVTGQ